ncbi:MAG: hypothetical protein A3I33_00910 [Candidatus Colwellbacteria bacterium RIFCSPLOWO2_02_FULL_45_11]|uniref:DUF4399 domain-containing protein n=2 Tax=Parcubacteria group TaxID=1794811 RepID=A0A0H4TP84_9BACT|nr:hypothetical protein [uncultured Parcubacteria bacterium Rifle_16ft_4_minimus_37647]OGY61104.1 MAG: hypothetical protein A3I33_00910 [Candidatus Colwellbacteria bacterium RIFCSPLOWO2_02_FULL_45_11]
MRTKLLITFTMIGTLVAGAVAFAQTETPNPTVTITSPIDGEKYGGKPIEFLFGVTDFTFVSYKNSTVLFPGNPNAGHAHLWIDPPQLDGTEDTIYEVESPDFHELGALEPGRYTLSIELVKNDHTRFEPRVYDSVAFRVTERTERGRYAIIKTETPETAGEAPPRMTALRIIFGIALVFILIWGINRLRKQGLLKKEGIRRLFTASKSLLSGSVSRITAPVRKIYARIRRKE